MAGRTVRSEFEGTAAQKESCSKSGRTPRRRLPEARPVAVQDAAMARRRAPHLLKRKMRNRTTRRAFSARHPLVFHEGKERQAYPGPRQRTGAATHWLFDK